jgi:serine protease Do
MTTRIRQSLYLAVAAVLAAASGSEGAEPGAGGPLTPAQISARASASVVLIKTATGLGSGFIAGSGGRVATSLHVLASGGPITVVLSDSSEITDLEVMATDETHDLAVLRARGLRAAPLPLGDSQSVRAGDRVVAIGHPLGLDHTVSDGLVSAVRELTPKLTLLQISAPISPGSSGGPLLNDRGEVIGVATLVLIKGQNLNFGIPINAVKPLLLANQGTPVARWRPPPTTGTELRRSVPRHDAGFLDGCSEAETAEVARRIDDAIALGVPLYNDGQHEACYRIYESTGREIKRKVAGCTPAAQALDAGMERADRLGDYSAKAWAMRDAFDGLLDVITRRARANPRKLPAPPPRHVPHHALTMLADCSPEAITKLGRTIQSAIEVGAPMYNDGDYDACLSIYETTVKSLTKSLAGCAAAKQALGAGLREADARRGSVAKAWALRDAFDGILEVIARRTGP